MAGMIYLEDGEPFCAIFPELDEAATGEPGAIWSITLPERDRATKASSPIRVLDRSEPGDPDRRLQLVDATDAILLISWLTRNRPEHLVGG